MSLGAGDRAGPAAPFEVIVVAASLGGPAAVNAVVGALPAEFPVPVLLVQHRGPTTDDRLAEVLGRCTPLAVRPAATGLTVNDRGVTVLPPRHTATINGDKQLVVRPATDYRVADPLIASAGETFGSRALCVVLTGRLEDAATGVRTLKKHGGRTIVEDPASAAAPGMPSAALATGCVDLVLPLHHIARALIALAMAPGGADLLRVPPSPWAHLAA
jgi:two-component system chemotaxis response regulator CheB